MRILSNTAILSLILATTACGGRSTDEADVNALAQHLTGKNSSVGLRLTKDQARCVAEVYLASDLSDQALDAVRAGKPLRPETKDDARAMNEVSSKIATECL